MHFGIKSVAACAMLVSVSASFAQKGETVKIAWLDPLSGLMAAVGTNQLKTTQYLADEFNKKNASGVKFEIIAIDNKLSPQETTAALRSAQDQGARYITQGNGSGPALAIIDAVEKNNARNPGKELLYLNYAAVDPDLTNSKCSYWHFRLDADTSMKMEALTTWMKDQADIKKVYILGQNYSHGQQVSKFAKDNLKTKRPDIQIVGDDLHPLAQVRDFSPYIAKIKASGADTVITGNWGSDLSLLIKAANDSGLDVKFLTYYAPGAGTPTAMGATSAGKVYTVAYAHYNMGGEIQRLLTGYKKKMNDDLTQSSIYHTFALLDAAFVQTKSTDPVKVAAALEGMKIKSFNGEVEMRKADHQLQQGLYISRWEKASAKYPYDAENTGYTNVPVKYYESYVASTPTTCQMKRP
ncbi:MULTISPECIES: branched-chain amino acid ABC transporter substrate-binding protein [Variovorax]|uniref:Branched-chain amino acid ABC transporter substrate-binding protein n=1 Tax=Variovorax boronicumulans TaxID=436515 RepID=A0A1E7U9U0_9BURK|nr:MULTISPECIES: branched-chain amino acid ABC transporter substrate-binding protein [Variovorax]ATA54803.1 branched-chain amino acid ABC transporter substrate-binding protein [Variovorax boronicumulans]MDP9881141.1 branched-chain amino acid transport system substrate-binding protein [Variovorax boronicumulans]MDP9909038.1 branched-chain amino acid transport system substrate-binding protein [Variovorax boronicumulans]MDP9920636.1 branched-chain amino acid transport system substrate-binding prot